MLNAKESYPSKRFTVRLVRELTVRELRPESRYAASVDLINILETVDMLFICITVIHAFAFDREGSLAVRNKVHVDMKQVATSLGIYDAAQ